MQEKRRSTDAQRWIKEHPIWTIVIGVFTAIIADTVVDEIAAPVVSSRHRDEINRLDSIVVEQRKLIVQTQESIEVLDEIEDSLDSLLILLNAEGHRF